MALTPEQVRRLRRDKSSGNRLRAARQLTNLRQEELASFIGITQGALSDLERQRYPNTTIETARRFAEFFGCSIEDLFPAKVEVAS